MIYPNTESLRVCADELTQLSHLKNIESARSVAARTPENIEVQNLEINTCT